METNNTTKVTEGAGHFDVMYYGMENRIAEDIYKPYSKYGVKAHLEALKEAIESLPKGKVPSYIIVIDRATLKAKVFVNQREVKLRVGELEGMVEKYKKFFKDKTLNEGVRIIQSNTKEKEVELQESLRRTNEIINSRETGGRS